jgi:hypothetical protein
VDAVDAAAVQLEHEDASKCPPSAPAPHERLQEVELLLHRFGAVVLVEGLVDDLRHRRPQVRGVAHLQEGVRRDRYLDYQQRQQDDGELQSIRSHARGGLRRRITVVSMQVLSLIAPQQPKKAVTKMTEPMAMRRMGGSPKWYLSGMKFWMSSFLSLRRMPKASKPAPAICKSMRLIGSDLIDAIIALLSLEFIENAPNRSARFERGAEKGVAATTNTNSQFRRQFRRPNRRPRRCK